MKNKQVILFRIAYTFMAILFFSITSCSTDEDNECMCNAQYHNEYDNTYKYELQPCDEVKMIDGDFYFVKCVDKPDY